MAVDEFEERKRLRNNNKKRNINQSRVNAAFFFAVGDWSGRGDVGQIDLNEKDVNA